MGTNPITVKGSELKCGDLLRWRGKDVIISRVEPPFLESGLILLEFDNGESDCTEPKSTWLVYRKDK